MAQSLRQTDSASAWIDSDFSTLNEKYSPWMTWQPGKNLAFEKSTQKFRLIEIQSHVSTTASDSQWSQSDSWKLESYRVDENIDFNLIQPFSSDFYDIWFSSVPKNPSELQRKIESLAFPQNEHDFIQHKMAWIIYWQNLILTNPARKFDLTTTLNNYFQFLSLLKPNDFAIGSSGFDLQYPLQLCNEAQLIQWLQEKAPVACWKALEKIFLKNQKLPNSALNFWRQYLTAPNPNILSEIQNLNHDFLKSIYLDWQQNANLNTDMNQYQWQNLKKIITSN